MIKDINQNYSENDIKLKIADILLHENKIFVLVWEKDIGGYCINRLWESLNLIDWSIGIAALEQITCEADIEMCRKYISILKGDNIDFVSENPVPQNNQDAYLQLKDNSYTIQCHIKSHIVRDEDGNIIKYITMIQEMSEEQKYRLMLARNITNDKNPMYFAEEARKLIGQFHDMKFCLIQFDVARFKLINEQYGEAMGDELLNYFIQMLRVICNHYQLYTRLTSDVFMILTAYEKKEDIINFVDIIRDKLSGYKNIQYNLYFGVSFVENNDEPLRKFGDEAAFARFSIKGDALQYVAFYNKSMKSAAASKKAMEDCMEGALLNKEFLMYLQPKFNIADGKLIGAEALVRWDSSELGFVQPGSFIPLFEENGFIIKMDKYIWEQACITIKTWCEMGLEPIPISVNMSRKHLANDASIVFLNNLIEKYGIDKRYIEIELTETVDEGAIENGICILKKYGYTLLMDDFGSGFSSLNTLKDTQFDVIKIDRLFLKNFIETERGKKIVKHTIRMTKDLGLEMIAEGVETLEAARFLLECGCPSAQGYYYDKPLPLEEFNKKYR